MIWVFIKAIIFFSIAVALAVAFNFVKDTDGTLTIDLLNREYQLSFISFFALILALLFFILKLGGFVRASYATKAYSSVDMSSKTDNRRPEELIVLLFDKACSCLRRASMLPVETMHELELTERLALLEDFHKSTSKAMQIVVALREMLDAGLKVSVNSDDPAYMGSEYITEVLIRAQKDSALTPAELVQFERFAFETAWIPEEQRDGYLAKLEAYAQSWGVAA